MNIAAYENDLHSLTDAQLREEALAKFAGYLWWRRDDQSLLVRVIQAEYKLRCMAKELDEDVAEARRRRREEAKANQGDKPF